MVPVDCFTAPSYVIPVYEVGDTVYGTRLYTIIRESTGEQTPPIVNSRAQTTSGHDTVHIKMKS